MIEIIHVSDLHFRKGLFSWFHNRKAVSLLKKISRMFDFKDDQYLLVTGDITQSGDKAGYKTAGKALKPFKNKIFITPGNHDYGSLFGTVYSEDKAKYFDKPFAESLGFVHSFFDKRVYYKELKDRSGQSTFIIIGLNSCSRTGLHDFAQGEIGHKQLNELKGKLAENDTLIPKLLFLHHIPYKDAEWEEIMTLKDWEKLMDVIKDKVNVLAFGHQGGKLVVVPDRNSEFIPAAPRSMQKRFFNRDGSGCLILDADGSVDKQSFYHITLNGTELSAKVVKV